VWVEQAVYFLGIIDFAPTVIPNTILSTQEALLGTQSKARSTGRSYVVVPGVISDHLKGAIGGTKQPAGSASPHREYPLLD